MRWSSARVGSILAAALVLSYLAGLDHHGITNWQEGIRLLAAQDMAKRSDWVVPTIHGEPYLAKPPLIYWGQLTSAKLRGAAEPSLFDLRLVVAVAGLLGLLATYVAARVLLAPDVNGDESASVDEADPRMNARSAALWAVALAGTGILYVRSSRIGELDVLLIPTVAGCIACGGFAVLATGRVAGRGVAVLGAMVCAALAALAKGPAGLLVVGCALPIGVAIAAIGGSPALRLRLLRVGLALGITALCAAAAFGALWAWSRGVAASLGQEAVDAAIRTESGENLRMLEAKAWTRNLETMLYGCGLASLLLVPAIGRLVLLRPPRRVRLTCGTWIVIAWVICSYIAFSLTTKGVPRYLTPVWPGVAILAAWWLTQRVEETRAHPRLNPRAFCAAVIGLLLLGQTVWYGVGREVRQGDRTPRLLAEELVARGVVSPGSLGSYDLWSPALDLEFGFAVAPWKGPANTADTPHTEPSPIELLADAIGQGATPGYVLLIRDGPVRGREGAGQAIDQLRSLGLDVRQIETTSRWTIDNGRTRVVPVRLGPVKQSDS